MKWIRDRRQASFIFLAIVLLSTITSAGSTVAQEPVSETPPNSPRGVCDPPDHCIPGAKSIGATQGSVKKVRCDNCQDGPQGPPVPCNPNGCYVGCWPMATATLVKFWRENYPNLWKNNLEDTVLDIRSRYSDDWYWTEPGGNFGLTGTNSKNASNALRRYVNSRNTGASFSVKAENPSFAKIKELVDQGIPFGIGFGGHAYTGIGYRDDEDKDKRLLIAIPNKYNRLDPEYFTYYDLDFADNAHIVYIKPFFPPPEGPKVIAYRDKDYQSSGYPEGDGYVVIPPIDDKKVTLRDSFGASSIYIPLGIEAILGQRQGRGRLILNANDENFSNNRFDNGSKVNDNVGSITVNRCPQTLNGDTAAIVYKERGYSCGGVSQGYVVANQYSCYNIDFTPYSVKVRDGYYVTIHATKPPFFADRFFGSDPFFIPKGTPGYTVCGYKHDEFCEVTSAQSLRVESCTENNRPEKPSITAPRDGYIANDHLAPTLCWEGEDPDGDQLEYKVEIYDSPVTLSSGWIEGNCWRPKQLDYEYYSYNWRVKSRDPAGAQSAWSSPRSFTISPPNRPPVVHFDSANNSGFDNYLNTNVRDWTFAGRASDPEGHLNRVEIRCKGDNCGSGDKRSYSSSWSISRNGMAGRNDVYFVAYDDEGHYSFSRHLDLRIDLAAPTTRISLNGQANSSKWPTWFTDPVPVRLHAKDNSTGRARSGIAWMAYRLDGGAWEGPFTRDTVKFTVSSDGEHTIAYHASDKAGNDEAARTATFKIDQTPPTPPSGAVEVNGTPHNVWQRDYNIPAFTWDASTDATSGVWGYQFYFGKDPQGTSNHIIRASEPREWTPQPGGVHTGVYYLRGRARDVAGNWSAWTDLFTFRYDETPPENPDDVAHTANITNTVWQRVTNTADFTWPVPHDEGSGIQGYYVYWGTDQSGTTTDFIQDNTFQDATPLCAEEGVCTGYLRLRGVDNVDNLAREWSTGFVLRYDNIPPTATFTFNGGMTNTNQTRVVLNIDADDLGSGVKAMRFSTNGIDWLPWEVYTTTRGWVIPSISRQDWPVYMQVRDGVGLKSDIISRTIYLEVNRAQPRSTAFRLFDHTLSAGAESLTSTLYTGHGTVGQIGDAPVVTSTNYQVSWGYEAGSQAIPLVVPGHDDYYFINGVFGSSNGATVMTSTQFTMLGTFNEPGLPTNTTTLTSSFFTHQPGFLAAAPPLRAQEITPTQTLGAPPIKEPPLACETPYIYIDNDAPFTNKLTTTLNLCAPHATEMMISNNISLTNATWEPYTITKTWILSNTGPQTSARHVYATFKDDTGMVYKTYFDDIIYDTGTPSVTVGLDFELVTPDSPGLEAVDLASMPLLVRYPQLASSNDIPIYVEVTDDNSGIVEVQFSDNITFTGATWQPYAPVMHYTPSGGDGIKTIYARVRDGGGNISPVSEATFVYDTHGPEGTLDFGKPVVNTEAVTSTLYFDVWDDWSGVEDMRFSTDSSFVDTPWQPYSYTLTYPLSLTTQNAYTLYVQYRDHSQNLSKVYSNSLQVDAEPPRVYVDVAAGDTLTRTITVYAYDELSGVANRYISNDPLMFEDVMTMPHTVTTTRAFSDSRLAFVQVEDNVGNLSEPYPIYARESELQSGKIYLPLVMKD